jgi:hypothetical protein
MDYYFQFSSLSGRLGRVCAGLLLQAMSKKKQEKDDDDDDDDGGRRNEIEIDDDVEMMADEEEEDEKLFLASHKCTHTHTPVDDCYFNDELQSNHFSHITSLLSSSCYLCINK